MLGASQQTIMAYTRKSVPLNPLRAFAIASRHATFTSAALEMGVTQVAISRQIAILENYLDANLFERRSQSVKLTALGRALGQQIAPLFEQIESATLDVLSSEREQIVSLRAYPTFAYHWLMPKLGAFKQLYPNFDIRLDTTVAPLDFRGTHLDIAIQLGNGDWRDSRSRELFPEEVDAVCSPEYAEKFDYFRDVSDIRHAELLHARYRRREWDYWARKNELELDVLRGYEFQTSLLAYSAAINGLGIAMGQLALIEDDLLKPKRLVRPFGKSIKTNQSFWIVWPAVVSVSTMTRKLIDWILVCAGREPEFFTSGNAGNKNIS